MTNKATHSYGYNAICDVCGFKKKNYELRQRWDGYMVCKEDWEQRNILDFYEPRNDTHKLPWTRPEPADTYVLGVVGGDGQHAIDGSVLDGSSIG